MKKLTIFDLDGTLTNTLGSIAHFLNVELDKYGIPHVTEDDVKIFTGDGAYNLVERVLKKNGIDDTGLLKNILDSYVSSYDADYLYLCKLYAGIKELVGELKKRGIKVACLTNKPHQTAISIISHFFNDDFSLIWGQREGFPIKPDPSGAFEIMKELKMDAKDSLYIGDTKTDVLTGKRAGCFTIGVLWGFRDRKELEGAGADAIIKSPNELLAFL
jgi:HAD hydrolase, family IA, variant 1